jgi:ribonuclease HI
VESFIHDLEYALPSKPIISPCRKFTVKRWIAPPAGFVKFNVDAAVKKTSKAGAIAAVCRAENGDFLGTSAVIIQGIDDPATLEAMACREALSLAEDLNITRARIATDCLEVVNSMKGPYFGRFSSVMKEINSRSRVFAALEFVHERRSSNTEAHGLARSSVSRDTGRHVWLAQTPDESCIPMFLVVQQSGGRWFSKKKKKSSRLCEMFTQYWL